MPVSHEPPKLKKRHLVAVFVAVLVVAGAVVGLSLHAAAQVTEKSERLVQKHIPELRVISDLHRIMNLQVRQLYLYYATADSADYLRFVPLREDFHAHLARVLNIEPGHMDLPFLREQVARFEAEVRAFHDEMSKGSDRDWDQLRDELADAQEHAEAVDAVLMRWQEDTRKRASAGARLTLQEIKRMNLLQLGFSAAVMLMAAFFLVTWYKRFQDHARIYHGAYHEWVTGLPNRRRLEQSWEQRTFEEGATPPEALLLVGLDSLQMVTGTFGHLVGDQLLLAVSRWIQDVLAATAADAELYYLLPGVWLIRIPRARSGRARRADAASAAAIPASDGTRHAGDQHQLQHWSDLVSRRWCVDHRLVESWRCGPAPSLPSGWAMRSRLCAQHARAGRASLVYGKRPTQRRMTKAHIPTQRDELVLHYQPKVNARSGDLVGAEVLVRWQRDGTLVYPGAFIPIAEQSALIIPVGEWILDRACRQWAQWQQEGIPPWPLAVNISAQQFHRPNFPQRVADILAATGMPASMLELEITEEAAAENPEQVIATMAELKSIGVTLAVDDFGTGYSSLAYLKRFPIDVLKIDRSFVRDIEGSPQDRSIIDTLLVLALDLGLKVVAEGVESEAQRDWLCQRECHVLQGYLFSRPLAADDYIGYILSERQPDFIQKLPEPIALRSALMNRDSAQSE